MRSELHCTIEVRGGVAWARLAGALRSSSAHALVALARARAVASAAVADLRALEVADSFGAQALDEELRGFAWSNFIAPSAAQAAAVVRAVLTAARQVRRLDAAIGGAERRRAPRIAVSLPAALRWGGTTLEVVTQDLSRTGVRLVARDFDVPDLRRLRCHLRLPALGLRSAAVRVVHAEPRALGVALPGLSAAALRTLERLTGLAP